MPSYDIIGTVAGEQMELGLRGSECRSTRSPGWRDLLRDSEVRSWELIRDLDAQQRHHLSDRAIYFLDDATCWLHTVPDVRASLPLGIGIIYDPFAGSASTLAAAAAVGYRAIGTDRDEQYFQMGQKAFPELVAFSSSERTEDRRVSGVR
jgi:hypothetical protein